MKNNAAKIRSFLLKRKLFAISFLFRRKIFAISFLFRRKLSPFSFLFRRKYPPFFPRNTFVATSSIPFNLIATIL